MGVATLAAAQQTGKLAVTVQYKGAGTVDKTHQIFVWVFDTPDINENSVPITVDQATSNDAMPLSARVSMTQGEGLAFTA